jgi:DNA-binding response OmpR family regulator
MATIPPRSRPQTVLVVDDNLHNRLLMEAQLGDCGYTVLLAVSGGEALELFRREEPDLVLLDVMMPDMDGFETCRRMRALQGGADTAILFVTALDDPSALDAAADAGGDDYLTKPINREELVLRVRSLLRIRRLGRELQRSYDALSSLERQKAELSQFVVHDLKNPLAAILANAQFALTTEVPEEAREALCDIATSVERMNAMLLDLLDIGRGEGGDLQLHPEPLRLDVLVREAHHADRDSLGTARCCAPEPTCAHCLLVVRTS